MSKSSPVVLILGAGSNVGQHAARAFSEKGYKVGLVARSLKQENSDENCINIPADLSNPDAIVNAFAEVTSSLGIPSVVIYNGICRFIVPLPEIRCLPTLLLNSLRSNQ